jgi:predicted PurR-regulated permease PerM
MIEEKTLNQIIVVVFIAVLLFFTYLILKPIFIAVLFGLILAYMFNPLDKLLLKLLKNKTLTTTITAIIAFALGFITLWFLLPILARQIFDAYVLLQSFDIINFLKGTFPPLFSSQQITSTIESSYNAFIANATKTSLEKLTGIINNLPIFLIKGVIVIIVFFYALRDGDKILNMLRDSLPFKRETTNKFIFKSGQVTYSVVYGRVLIGIIIGVLAGIGFYFAGVKNVILLSFLAMIMSILPLIGPWAIWIPVVVALFISGNTFSALFLLIYSLIVIALFENIATPLIVSKQSQLPTLLTFIGIFGGLIAFGIFGIILGPLIMAYLMVLFEIYREKNKREQLITN